MPRLDTWHSLASRAKGLNGLMAARDTDMASLLVAWTAVPMDCMKE